MSFRATYTPVAGGRKIQGVGQALGYLISTLVAAVLRLERSFDPKLTLARLKSHVWTYHDLIYAVHATLWIFWISLWPAPFLFKIAIPSIYVIAILLPITSQFFFPALPILTWVITFFSSRFIPVAYRPPISVSFLPTLESVLYGANISDILTRFTHPLLDIPAWLSYGVIHFVGPFVVAAFLWLFSPKGALKYWASAFGYLNLTGVIIQILFPCAPPWYELRNGLTPADYSMKGSPGGLARIDAIFHSNAYTVAFSNAPVVFGAFPSLHAADATIAALFVSHFWPQLRTYAWGYAGLLYGATMYLTHHYLIDVVVGACLAIVFFYTFMPPFLRFPATPANASYQPVARNKYEQYDLEASGVRTANGHFRADSSSDPENDDLPPNPLAPYHTHSRRSTVDLTAVIPPSPRSAVPLAKSHRHTASIASLIRAEERVPDGWNSPPATNRAFGVNGSSATLSVGDLAPAPTGVPLDSSNIARTRSPSLPKREDTE